MWIKKIYKPNGWVKFWFYVKRYEDFELTWQAKWVEQIDSFIGFRPMMKKALNLKRKLGNQAKPPWRPSQANLVANSSQLGYQV